jgi:hypothetical protein
MSRLSSQQFDQHAETLARHAQACRQRWTHPGAPTGADVANVALRYSLRCGVPYAEAVGHVRRAAEGVADGPLTREQMEDVREVARRMGVSFARAMELRADARARRYGRADTPRRPASGASAEEWKRWMEQLADEDKVGQEPPGGSPPRGDDPAAVSQAEGKRAAANPGPLVTLNGRNTVTAKKITGHAIRTALKWGEREQDRTGVVPNWEYLCQELGI